MTGHLKTLLQLAAAAAVLAAPVHAQTADGLPRVLIIGDSISIGYTPYVVELLQGKAIVLHNPGNAQDTATGLDKLDQWLAGGDWDVIHFNWGLWDVRYDNGFENDPRVPLAQYETNLRALVARLKQTGAALIWGSTTPVPAKAARRNEAAEQPYNAAACRIMTENDIPVDDLHAFIAPRLAEYQQNANVHFRPEGYRALARQVADSILRQFPGAHPTADGVRVEVADLAATLEPILAEYDLPALAAAVVHDGRVVALGAVGERKYGSGVKVAPDDQFHLGSCTKAMTATLIAMLIEQGKLRWDTTLADALPKVPMLEAYRTVTIAHLLAHRAGLPNESWPTGKGFMDMHNLPGLPRQQRLAYAQMILNQPPKAAPGEKFIYSNAGYAILGVIAEETMDKSWEELIQSMLFEPLGMTTAGFGAMGTPGKIDQPWQHRYRMGLPLLGRKAIEPGKYSDNPAVIAPGGLVHCSIGDWAKFVILQLEDGTYNGRQLVKPETLHQLRTPQFGGDYAGGWGVCDRQWGGGRVFNHSGSNTMNYAVVWMAPLKRYAVLVATNQGGGKEDEALDKVASTLIGAFPP